MKVAGIQLDIRWEEPEVNLERAGGFVRDAAEAGAELVVLPEMFASGFSMASARVAAMSDTILEGVTAIARATGVTLVAGVASPSSGKPLNHAYAIAPDGTRLDAYEKIHPFSPAGEAEASLPAPRSSLCRS